MSFSRIKYRVVLKIRDLLTGETEIIDWSEHDEMPTEEEILKIKDNFYTKNKIALYAMVNVIYK